MTKINKEGWEIKKLTEVSTIQYGYAFDSKYFTDDSSQMPLIRIRDVVRGYSETFYNGEYPDSYIIKAGELLIGMDGEFNIARWQSRDALLNQRVCKITTASENLDEQYLYYFMKGSLKAIEDETPFVTVKHLSAKRLNQVSVNLPPLPIQQRIVEELDEINAIISAKKQQLSKLDELAQSIFYNMFGDPVANEMGWEVKKFKEFADAAIGLTYKPDNVVDDGIVVLRSGNIQESKIDLSDLVRVNAKIPDSKFVKDGDILMCTRNGSFRLVGKVAMIKALPEDMTYGAFMTIIRSKHNDYLFQYFKTPAFRQNLVHGKTTTVNQITVKMLQDLNIPLPPLPLQEAFAARVAAIEEEKAAIAASIEKMQTLLDARMQEYFG